VAIRCLAVLTLMLGLPLTYLYGGARTFGYLAGAAGLSVVLVYLAVNIAVIRAFRTEFREEFRFWRHLVIPAVATLLLLFPLWGILRPRSDPAVRSLREAGQSIHARRSWPAGADARPQRCARLAGLVTSRRVHILTVQDAVFRPAGAGPRPGPTVPRRR
jgi:amino acid transporter